MADTLIREYGLLDRMKTIDVDQDFVRQTDLTTFHSDDYVDCLKHISPDNKERFADQMREYNFTDCDCPVFEYMYEYC